MTERPLPALRGDQHVGAGSNASTCLSGSGGTTTPAALIPCLRPGQRKSRAAGHLAVHWPVKGVKTRLRSAKVN